MLPTLKSQLIVIALFQAVISPAIGTELCVVCAEPAMSYRCALEGDAATGPVPAGLQLLCVKELATRGGHKSCSVDRARTVETCNAALVTLARPAGEPPASLAIAPAATAPGAEPTVPGPAPFEPAANAPPATLEALAKDAAEQSKKDWETSQAKLKETTATAGQKIEQAGNAVGNAVKKSWDCVLSLFARC